MEKRISKNFICDKFLYKAIAHRAVDDECEIAEILEGLLENMLDDLLENGKSFQPPKSTNKWTKTVRLSKKHIEILDQLVEKTGLSYGKILDCAVDNYLIKKE